MAKYWRWWSLLSKSSFRIESIAIHCDLQQQQQQQQVSSETEEVPEKLTLFVGTNDGALLVYETCKNGPGKDILQCDDLALMLRMTLKRFNPSKRPVTQLKVVNKWGMLLSVLDGELAAHSLSGDPMLNPVAGGPSDVIQSEYGALAKGVIMYCVDVETDLLCVVCKRTLVIMKFNPAIGMRAGSSSSSSTFLLVRVMQTPETARAVEWIGSGQLCVGYQKDYAFYDANVGTEVKRPRVRTGARKFPVMCYVSGPTGRIDSSSSSSSASDVVSSRREEGELLCCKDNQGYFVGFDGVPSRSGGSRSTVPEFITWSDQPITVLACQPYILGFLGKHVEVHLGSNCTLCESLPLQGCTMYASNTDATCCSPSLLLQPSSRRKGLVFFANDKQMGVMVMTPLGEVVDNLLIPSSPRSEVTFEHALQLCKAGDGSIWGLHGYQACSDDHMFIGSGISPFGLEYLVASVHARYGLYFFTQEAANPCYKTAYKHLEHARNLSRLPLEFVLRLFGRTELFESEQDGITTALNLADLRTELGGMYHHFYQIQQGTDNTDPVLPSKVPASLAIDFETEHLVPVTFIDEATDLEYIAGQQLSKALLLVLLPYVLEYRESLLGLCGTDEKEHPHLQDLKSIVIEILGIIDTLLLKGFVLCDALSTSHHQKPKHDSTSSSASSSSKSETGGSSSSSSMSYLANTEMRALSARMMEQKMRFLRGRNWCFVEDCEKLLLLYPEMWEELLWLYYGKGLHEDALEWLYKLERNERRRKKGQDLDDNNTNIDEEEELIYSCTVGSSPYIAKTIEYLKSLGKNHTDIVLKYSKWIIRCCVAQDSLGIFIDPSPKVEPLDDKVVIKFLEQMDQEIMMKLMNSKTTEPQFQPLAVGFVDHIISHRDIQSPWYHNKLVLLYVESIMHLRAAASSSSSSSKQKQQQQEDEEEVRQDYKVKTLRKSLLEFLRTSKHYSAADLAPRFKATDLHEEYAILLSRLDRHDEALHIYIHELGSYKMAEEYCNRMYNPENPESKQIYSILLETLVGNKQIDNALDFVEGHVEHIDPAKVLEVLPPDLPLGKLQNFLSASLRYHASAERDVQIVKQLVRKEHISVRQELFQLHRNFAIITRRTTCANPKCQRPVQSDQAFARLPDGKIVHYACL